jgi:hypothetical protein
MSSEATSLLASSLAVKPRCYPSLSLTIYRLKLSTLLIPHEFSSRQLLSLSSCAHMTNTRRLQADIQVSGVEFETYMSILRSFKVVRLSLKQIIALFVVWCADSLLVC